MRFVRAAVPIVVPIALVFLVTAVLWILKESGIAPHHIVFFYLLPMALVAILFGSLPAMLCVVTATACAAYFLYDPAFSFAVGGPLEMGELFCFTGLALIGAKCVADLLRPAEVLSRQNPAARNPESGFYKS
jgi:K+-sensing histidine kinase KdpD